MHKLQFSTHFYSKLDYSYGWDDLTGKMFLFRMSVYWHKYFQTWYSSFLPVKDLFLGDFAKLLQRTNMYTIQLKYKHTITTLCIITYSLSIWDKDSCTAVLQAWVMSERQSCNSCSAVHLYSRSKFDAVTNTVSCQVQVFKAHKETWVSNWFTLNVLICAK